MLRSQKSSELMKERAQHCEIPWQGKGKVEKRMVEKRMVEKSQGLLCIGPKAILGESC